MTKKLIAAFILLLLIILNSNSRGEFRIIDKECGMAWGKFPISEDKEDPREVLMILRFDPRFCEMALLSRSELGTPLLTAAEWREQSGFGIIFNAGMYAADSISTIGFCRNYDHVIYPRLNRHKTVLVFNPKFDSVKAARIINRACEDFDLLKNQYNTFLQSIRMLDCDGRPTWKNSNKKHSILAIAEDSLANIYVIFSQYPLSVRDFTTEVLNHLPDLTDMMYLEGNMAACLYINIPDLQIDICGTAGDIWPPVFNSTKNVKLPNVITVRKKTVER